MNILNLNNILTRASDFNKESFYSANLYQLFSYLLNQEVKGFVYKSNRCSGLLLYPKVDVDLKESFKYNDHNIFIRTIDLHQEWPIIEENLKEMVYEVKDLNYYSILLATQRSYYWTF